MPYQANIYLDNAVHGSGGIALSIELEIFRNLIGANVADDFGGNLKVVCQLLQLILNFSIISVREERYIISDCSDAGSLGKAKKSVQGNHLNMVFRAFRDVKLSLKALNAELFEFGLQSILGNSSLEFDCRGNVRQIRGDLHIRTFLSCDSPIHGPTVLRKPFNRS